MKSWLKLDLKLQKVEEPSQLFFLMVKDELLSPENLHYLGEILSFAGRQDLRKQLEGELKILFGTTLFSAILAIRKADS